MLPTNIVVSRAALSLAVQYPERIQLVDAMIDLSREELAHFERIYRMLRACNASLGHEHPDPYMRALRKQLSNPDREEWLLRRLILFAVVECRGYERFQLLADHLVDRSIGAIYQEIARSEARHQGLYLRLARSYFVPSRVEPILDRILDIEAETMSAQRLQATLH